MTTFQVLIESFLKALTSILPISGLIPETLTRTLLEWTLPVAEIELLLKMTASLVILIFFRFDWLGMLSATLTTLVRPMSLKQDTRSLDQHTLIFMLMIFLPQPKLHPYQYIYVVLHPDVKGTHIQQHHLLHSVVVVEVAHA